jgi:hypothetical protein
MGPSDPLISEHFDKGFNSVGSADHQHGVSQYLRDSGSKKRMSVTLLWPKV